MIHVITKVGVRKLLYKKFLIRHIELWAVDIIVPIISLTPGHHTVH